MKEKIMMLSWCFKLDSDKWITEWMEAISFSSHFCSEGLFGLLFDAATKITPRMILCFHSLHPEKVLSHRSNSLTESFNVVWRILLHPHIFTSLSPSAFSQTSSILCSHPLTHCCHLDRHENTTDEMNYWDLRYSTENTNPLIPGDYLTAH